MVTCPVCEHQQAVASECEVCGRNLMGVAGAPPLVVERLPDLEVTLQEAVPLAAAEAMPELENHRSGAVAAPAIEVVPDLDRIAPVGEVPYLPLNDLSEDRAPDDGVRTALPTGAMTCRYCRNVQAHGLVCEKCGMRLRVSAALTAATSAKALAEQRRCRACGAPVTLGDRCGECGRVDRSGAE